SWYNLGKLTTKPGIKTAIRRRSKTSGVMITQYLANMPEGKSTPDFQCKPMAVTIEKGKLAAFKAVVTGDPKPDVSWRRAKGTLSDKERFQTKYDESTGEHILEVMSVAETDTYKCFAANEYGKAVCTTTLTVTEGKTSSTNPADFRKLLKKSKVERADGESDERFWDVMLKADRNDYERICSEFGVKDLHSILKKLDEKKKERSQNKRKDDIIPYDENGTEKHSLKSVGRTKNFSINGLMQKDMELFSKVDFVIKIQEIKAEEREDALFECVLTHPLPNITWMGKGNILEDGEKYSLTMSDHKLIHRLLIKDCQMLDKGIYSAVVGNISCNAWLVVEGITVYRYLNHWVQFICGLTDVSAIINEIAELTCKLSAEDCEGAWFRDGKQVSQTNIYTLYFCSGTVLCSPTHPSYCDNFHTMPNEFITEKKRKQVDLEDLSAFTEPKTVKVGHNAIFKLHFLGHKPIKIQWFREGEELQDDNNTRIEKSASHSRLLLSRCQRKDTGEIKIKLKNEHGFTEALSQLIVLDKPTPPLGPAEVTESSATCIEFRWRPPKDDGGSPVINYIMERQQVGRNTWKKIGEIPGVPSYRDTGVERGRKYCYRIRAVTAEGTSEVMETDEMQAGTLAFPGPPAPPKVVSAFDDCINLSWAPPSNTGGSRILGYILEKRKKGSNLWSVVNANDELIKGAVKGLKSMDMYWVRVIAINDGGESEPEELPNYVLAMPRFTNNKMKSFFVVRAGNSVRITVNFEASPRPAIIWLKDNVPVTKRITISNSDGSSQLLIPSSERSDSGIYSILVKNLVGQETLSAEVRVTDDPKPPGPVELEENVPGTVTVIWEPSPDEKRDDRLHYTVSKLDSTKRSWVTVADRLFNNKFTVCNIMHGREYHFRVYAKNDMGISAPSESPTWGVEKKKEKFLVTLHTAPKGYECYMSCAVKGNPKPRITWYRNHISLNTNTNYYISNTCGVCTMLILRVGPKDMGEYSVIAENSLGRAECATILNVRGEKKIYWLYLQ
uniref:Immunoglobulin like and fibronectin type III domain containing 1, tandem duplicate 3 n=1 Tax=Oreochromis niloticus TaxID=8128 RepID=A0A669EUG2_ORENI